MTNKKKVKGISSFDLLLRFLGRGKVVFGTVLAGSTVFALFEETIEGGNAGEACLQCDFSNGQVGFCQKLFGHLDSSVT